MGGLGFEGGGGGALAAFGGEGADGGGVVVAGVGVAGADAEGDVEGGGVGESAGAEEGEEGEGLLDVHVGLSGGLEKVDGFCGFVGVAVCGIWWNGYLVDWSEGVVVE